MKNLQGDVIAITDRGGLVVARYSYDAWGVCTVEQDSAYCIGGINLYRYRSITAIEKNFAKVREVIRTKKN